ncbi:hypothetical protein PBCV1_a178L [Paramecium bursaria Chlorella virus 1]|uniref:Uncharacterized protein n=1 Tax=Paramecium bursaria Chlorella virus 1 TaxID=10506 RepID=Q84498_PBCV1|nr:hypothetical protein PBCV1_a178L [Paramecium bursaria Chlorella virus 1]AAC96546.1 hypothetical protein [Paramecium bursaria Chlorella virus 1]
MFIRFNTGSRIANELLRVFIKRRFRYIPFHIAFMNLVIFNAHELIRTILRQPTPLSMPKYQSRYFFNLELSVQFSLKLRRL